MAKSIRRKDVRVVAEGFVDESVGRRHASPLDERGCRQRQDPQR
jgi:hypothetical protein